MDLNKFPHKAQQAAIIAHLLYQVPLITLWSYLARGFWSPETDNYQIPILQPNRYLARLFLYLPLKHRLADSCVVAFGRKANFERKTISMGVKVVLRILCKPNFRFDMLQTYRHTISEENKQLCQDVTPMWDRHGPFFCNLYCHQV